MKLTILERLIFGVLYPKEGTRITQVLVKDIKKKVEFSQEEFKELEFKATDEGYTWKQDKVKDIDYTFTKAELELLKEEVKKLDTQKKITQENLSLCDKIADEQPVD